MLRLPVTRCFTVLNLKWYSKKAMMSGIAVNHALFLNELSRDIIGYKPRMIARQLVLVVRNDQKMGKLKIVGQCIRIVQMGEFENEGFILDDLYDNEEDGQHIDDGKQKRRKERDLALHKLVLKQANVAVVKIREKDDG
ncbi:hypothetical protein Tco_0850490, partial [Tanacetum coccineum]